MFLLAVFVRENTLANTQGEFVCGFADKSLKIKAHNSRCCGVIFICAVYKLFNMFAGFQTCRILIGWQPHHPNSKQCQIYVKSPRHKVVKRLRAQ